MNFVLVQNLLFSVAQWKTVSLDICYILSRCLTRTISSIVCKGWHSALSYLPMLEMTVREKCDECSVLKNEVFNVAALRFTLTISLWVRFVKKNKDSVAHFSSFLFGINPANILLIPASNTSIFLFSKICTLRKLRHHWVDSVCFGKECWFNIFTAVYNAIGFLKLLF